MATIPSFRTWSTGEIVRAAYFNGNVRDAGNFFLSVPTCECRQTIAQSIPDSSGTAISFNRNDIDTDSGHDTVNNSSTYVARTPGRYQVQGGMSLAAHADTNARQVEIDLNGDSVNGSDVCVSGFSADNIRLETRLKFIFMNSGDGVSISIFQASGVSLNTVVGSASQQPNMSVRWVGTT